MAKTPLVVTISTGHLIPVLAIALYASCGIRIQTFSCSTSTTWELVRNVHSQALPRLTGLKARWCAQDMGRRRQAAFQQALHMTLSYTQVREHCLHIRITDLESCFLICNLGCLLYLEVPLSLVDSPFKISLWHNYGQEHVEPTATDLSHWCLLQNSPDRSSPGWMAIWMALPHKVIQGPGFFHLVAPPHHSCCPYLNTGNGVPATSVFKHIQIGWLEIYF